MKRKKHRRKYRTHSSVNVKRGFAPVIIAICFSIAAGYMTATYLIGPALGLESQMTFFNFVNEDRQDNEKESKENKETNKTEETQVVQDSVDNGSGFAIQYGSFTEKEGAQKCVEELKASGIDAEIIKKDNMFKVIGEIFDTETEARAQKEKSEIEDVFITEIP